jgi:hypothetical protein
VQQVFAETMPTRVVYPGCGLPRGYFCSVTPP